MTDEPAHPSSFDSARIDRDLLDADTLDPSSFDLTILAQLACPACYSGLRLEGARLRCVACSRGYPIVDGIPVLIIERAGRPNEES